MQFLNWYNLIFLIPLLVGLLLALGMAVGFMDLPHGVDLDGDGEPDAWLGSEGTLDHDVGHDVGHGAEHAPEGPPGNSFSLLSALGFGKVPVLLVTMVLLLVFGGTGILFNMAFHETLKASGGWFAIVTLLCSILLTGLFTGTFSRIVSKLMPTLETNKTAKMDLVGCTGSVILAFDPHKGVAQIRRAGDMYQIQYTSDESLTKGQSILVTDYDEEHKVYDVASNPVAT